MVSITKQFPLILRAEMAKKGMSISELAERAKVGRPFLHRILSGEQVPTLTSVEKICRPLGITITFD